MIVAETVDALTDEGLLETWTAGRHSNVAERAELLLATAGVRVPPDELTLGALDAHLLDLRAAVFGPRVELTADCPACGDQLQTGFDIDDVRVGGERSDALLEVATSDEAYRVLFRLPTLARSAGPRRCRQRRGGTADAHPTMRRGRTAAGHAGRRRFASRRGRATDGRRHGRERRPGGRPLRDGLSDVSPRVGGAVRCRGVRVDRDRRPGAAADRRRPHPGHGVRLERGRRRPPAGLRDARRTWTWCSDERLPVGRREAGARGAAGGPPGRATGDTAGRAAGSGGPVGAAWWPGAVAAPVDRG